MMWLAVHELIRPKWTEQIHEEWMRNLLKDRPDLTREQLARTQAADHSQRLVDGCGVLGSNAAGDEARLHQVGCGAGHRASPPGHDQL